MLNDIRNEFYLKIFKTHICPICGLCESSQPGFCIVIYGANSNKFYEILSFIRCLKLYNRKKYKNLFTFEGFCGLFCNSKKICPHSSSRCLDLNQRIECYKAFIDQSKAVLTEEVKFEIYRLFSNINAKEIGTKFNLPKGLPGLNKKQRKGIKKTINAAKIGMRTSLIGYRLHCLTDIPCELYPEMGNSDRKRISRKKITTAFFSNEDKAWQTKIDKILSSENEHKKGGKHE